MLHSMLGTTIQISLSLEQMEQLRLVFAVYVTLWIRDLRSLFK